MALAGALGIRCERVTDANQITPELFDGQLKVVEVVLEEDEILAPKVSALPQPDGSIVSMPLEDMSPLLSRADLRREMIVPLHPTSEKVGR
jgi:acetolactate synthase-1/2/3 large subunit